VTLPVEFLLFGATLLGVMLFHGQHLKVALIGLTSIAVVKLLFSDISLLSHIGHEASLLLNLFGLLVGFELMACHFKESRLAEKVPLILPDDWKGPFFLLVLIFVLSIFLDNIAAAIIGASLARVVFNGRVRVGYLAAIVASSNAGGAGSVVGDTTTTMMWIAGVDWHDVTHAFLPAAVALLVFGIPLSIAQQRYQPIMKDADTDGSGQPIEVDYFRVLIVVAMLVGVIIGNVMVALPAVGLWVVILATNWIRASHWKEVPGAAINACFLLALVTAASLMPVEQLPDPSQWTVLLLGFVSSIFDNIPLTKLALDQGGYDWGWLAYAVGFGGSMMWFGSSAGVAVAKDSPEMRNILTFLKESWIIVLAYVVGFCSLFLLGWHPRAISSL
jgi:Na+/H+ antiporter NhaD/arsenite permease-like protein